MLSTRSKLTTRSTPLQYLMIIDDKNPDIAFSDKKPLSVELLSATDIEFWSSTYNELNLDSIAFLRRSSHQLYYSYSLLFPSTRFSRLAAHTPEAMEGS